MVPSAVTTKGGGCPGGSEPAAGPTAGEHRRATGLKVRSHSWLCVECANAVVMALWRASMTGRLSGWVTR